MDLPRPIDVLPHRPPFLFVDELVVRRATLRLTASAGDGTATLGDHFRNR